MGLDYTIQYKKGSENKAADALSRRVNLEEGETAKALAVTELIPSWMEELRASYEGDDWAKNFIEENGSSVIQSKFTIHMGLIRYKNRLYVGTSEGWRCKVVQWMHDSSVGGHSGVLGTYQRTKKIFYWPKMKEFIWTHVRSCEVCQLNKHENTAPLGLLDPIPVPDGAWEVISMDFIQGLPKSNNRDGILVIRDKFTKYGHFIPFSHPIKATEVAQLFLEQVYKLHGLSVKISTDRDPIFTSLFWKELMTKLEIKLNLSTAYHPQTDGQTERLNQCVEQYLRCMIGEQPKKWANWIYLAEWWYNTNYHTALQDTPFKALYGYEPPHIPIGSPPKCSVQAVDEMLRERHQMLQQLKEKLIKAQEKMKKMADRKRIERHFQVGDWVYLKLQPYRQISVKERPNYKLSSKYCGPFEIIEKIGKVAYKLRLPDHSQIHHVFHVSQLKAKIGNGVSPSVLLPMVGPEGKLQIEPIAILERRMVKKRNGAIPQILVRWSNLPDYDATWEDYDHIRQQFPNHQLEDMPNSKGGGMSSMAMCKLGIAVEEKFELVNEAEEKEERRDGLLGPRNN